jgi:cyclase
MSALATRVIARLDVKPTLGVVKGVRMEGLRVVGDPHTLALRYADQGADEILYLDVTASLYGRPAIHELVTRTARDVYVPLTVGGGIRTVADVRRLLRAGADKVAINTAALERPVFITELAKTFGSQALVVSVEIRAMHGSWDAYTNTGRDSARRALDWCIEAVERGAGELLVTSVDRDGTQQGLDLEFMATLSVVQVPVVLAGGFGDPDDAARAVTAGADAVAIGAWLHAGGRIQDVKDALAQAGREVRR